MTDKRKERVQRVNQKQLARPVTFWMTRDSDGQGKLCELVDIWLARPTRLLLTGGGAFWMVTEPIDVVHTADGEVPARFAQWSVDTCTTGYHVAPQTDRECVRIGAESERARPVTGA